MPHVVMDKCHLCRFTDCMTVCPVECFHADDERTYIDPGVCIHCGACIPACPVHAIFEASTDPKVSTVGSPSMPSGLPLLPVISDKQVPLPTAEARKRELGY